MKINQESLRKILVSLKIVSSEDLERIEKQAKKTQLPLEQILVKEKILSQNQLIDLLASHFYHIPSVDLKKKIIEREILLLIPQPIARKHETVAFERKGNILKVATTQPDDLQTLEFIKKKTNLDLEVYFTDEESIQKVLREYELSLEKEFEKIIPKEALVLTKENLKEFAEQISIIKVVDTLLEYAVYESASDIHIEPTEDRVIIRYRIDGILREVMSLPKEIQPGVIARIKVMANLKIDEHRLPQDGRFKISSTDYKVSIRVSILPVFDGEKIVLRLLPETAESLTLEQLGFQERILGLLKRNFKKPYGMILATGPTGSGKTTTLYAILNEINTPEVNISTIEDPIEYRMPRINQSQVSAKIGYTFANGLRSLLRQDPDIIMVGEIRDEETAEIAVHAALTGHLVLSTLHTNDAVTTLPRIIDLKVEPFLVASTVNLIIAQRLVRKICPNCIESYNLSKEAISNLEKEVDLKNLLKVMEKYQVISKNQDFSSLLFYRGKGCTQCRNEGLKGRIGIYELLEVSDEIKKLILEKKDISILLEKAREQGMITLLEDGFIKAKMGVTTIEEVLRVSRE